MSRAAFVFLFLLTIPHVVEALASGQEAPMRPVLICENRTKAAVKSEAITTAEKAIDRALVQEKLRVVRPRTPD
jgi:hypothetical protein